MFCIFRREDPTFFPPVEPQPLPLYVWVRNDLDHESDISFGVQVTTNLGNPYMVVATKSIPPNGLERFEIPANTQAIATMMLFYQLQNLNCVLRNVGFNSQNTPYLVSQIVNIENCS